MSLPDQVDELYNGLHRDDFRRVLQGEDEKLSKYIEQSIVRLHRIVSMMLLKKELYQGPTLDVGSGYGILYRAIKEFFPALLPYSVAELKPKQVVIDGQDIPCHKFHCDQDRLPLEDNSLGMILFCDVLEHLIVDPMWTLLEFNRVLRPGGHLLITTPNAAGAIRVKYALSGINPGREIEYKPTSIYQRHNREWTVPEVQLALQHAGFGDFDFTTHAHLLDPIEKQILQMRESLGIETNTHEFFFGPEIFFVGQKHEHRSLDDDLDPRHRWPEPLYASFEGYKKRPERFPIVIGEDYQ